MLLIVTVLIDLISFISIHKQLPFTLSSPRKPVHKLPLLQNSTVPSRASSTGVNKITTPTSTTPSKSNSLGRSTSSGAPPSNGSASPRGASKPAQLPQGPAYSIAAGGQQNSVAVPSNSSTSPTSTTSQPQAHKELTSSPTQSHGPSLHGSEGSGTTATVTGVPSSAVPTSIVGGGGGGEQSQPSQQQQVPPSPTQVSGVNIRTMYVVVYQRFPKLEKCCRQFREYCCD